MFEPRSMPYTKQLLIKINHTYRCKYCTVQPDMGMQGRLAHSKVLHKDMQVRNKVFDKDMLKGSMNSSLVQQGSMELLQEQRNMELNKN